VPQSTGTGSLWRLADGQTWIVPKFTAGAAAERAGVLIAGPLGPCFLPPFVGLRSVLVLAGLAGDLLRSGLL
jgi:hypothetical protein